MFSFTVFFSLLSLCYAANSTVSKPNHRNVAFPASRFMPKEWQDHSVKRASNSKLQATATGFVTTGLYFGDNTCSKETGYYATAVGVCFVAVDSKGNEVGSLAYNYEGTFTGMLKLSTDLYSTRDCSGEPTGNSPLILPTDCIGEPDMGLKYFYQEDSEPWTKYGEGLMFSYYADEDSCETEENSGLYGWYHLNVCIPSTNDDGSEYGFTFSTCADGIYGVTMFADSTCSTFVQAVQVPLMHCEVSTDGYDDQDDSVDPSKAIESFSCTA